MTTDTAHCRPGPPLADHHQVFLDGGEPQPLRLRAEWIQPLQATAARRHRAGAA